MSEGGKWTVTVELTWPVQSGELEKAYPDDTESDLAWRAFEKKMRQELEQTGFDYTLRSKPKRCD